MSGKTDGKFLRLPHEIYDGSAFKTLNHGDIVVLLLLRRKFNGHNNGAIALGVREAAAKCDCSMTRAAPSPVCSRRGSSSRPTKVTWSPISAGPTHRRD